MCKRITTVSICNSSKVEATQMAPSSGMGELWYVLRREYIRENQLLRPADGRINHSTKAVGLKKPLIK